MIIDLSCPVELRGYEMLNDDKGNTRAYVRLFNLSQRVITGYSATTNWYNGLTRARCTENITVDALRVPPRSAFKLIHSTQNPMAADHIELYFTGISFEDGGVWTPRDGDLVDIGEQPMLEGEELDLLKEKAGPDAVQYPQVQKKFWRCVCGRINLLDAETCARCERGQKCVLVTLNAKAVRKRAAPRRAAASVEPTGKKGAMRARLRRRSLLRAVKALLVALFILLLAYAGYRIGKSGVPGAPAQTPAPARQEQTVGPAQVYSPYFWRNKSGSNAARRLGQPHLGQSEQLA